jgi:hypothetical protein
MKKSKRGLMIILFMNFLFLINLFLAVCPSADDTIMKLSGSTNSHGALWNDPAYTANICCSSIFGATSNECTSAAGSEHVCTGSNQVAILSSSTNAHATKTCVKSPDLDNDGIFTSAEQSFLNDCIFFSIGCNPSHDLNNDGAYSIVGDAPCIPTTVNSRIVCYRDLVCEEVTDPAPCSAGYNAVVRLSADTNAHLQEAFANSYPVKICCKDSTGLPPPPTTGTVYWASMNGTPITSAQIGDTVLMVYENHAGMPYNFSIKEDDVSELVTLLDDEIRSVTNVFSKGSDLAAEWIITQADYNLGDDTGEFISNNNEEFYFKVNGVKSTILNVEKDSFDNTRPRTKIIKPVAESIYIINSSTGLTDSISFEQTSTDPDDNLKGIWYFGDGSNSGWILRCLTTGNCNKSYQYNRFGVKTIKFRVEEMTRSQWNEDATRVYVYRKGINVFAIIDKPLYNETVSGSIVNINANRSHADNCTDILAECTAAAPSTCYEKNDTNIPALKLYCYNLPGLTVKYNLIFEWTFDNDEKKTGMWNSTGYGEVVEFNQAFSNAGNHDIKLRVGYSPI